MTILEVSGPKIASVLLSAQDLGTINVKPVTVVPALGPGRKILPIFVAAEYLDDGNVFMATNGGGIPAFMYLDVKPAKSAGGSYLSSAPLRLTSYSGSQTGSATVQNTFFTNHNSAVGSSELENSDLVVFSSGPITGGPAPITAINPEVGTGSGYAIGDTGEISQGGNVTAGYVVDAVNGTGGVTACHLSFGGTQYSTAIGVPTVVGSGSGDGTFLVDIIATGVGSVRVTVMYIES